MLAYTYDANGYLNGITQCQINPKQENQYLVPAQSTLIAPPTVAANNIARWDGIEWSEVEDPAYSAMQEQLMAAAEIEAQRIAKEEATAEAEANNELILAESEKITQLTERNEWGVLLNKENDSGEVIDRDLQIIEDETLIAAMDILRSSRNAKLRECDWTQLPDSPLSSEQKTEWINYRQELRDLPANTEDPKTPNWPTEPGN